MFLIFFSREFLAVFRNEIQLFRRYRFREGLIAEIRADGPIIGHLSSRLLVVSRSEVGKFAEELVGIVFMDDVADLRRSFKTFFDVFPNF